MRLPWLAIPTLLALLLAGCSASPPPADAPAPAAGVITDPKDVAASAQPGSHVHDYWGGEDQVPVLRSESSAWSSCSGGCADGMTAAWDRPDEGAIVPQGTAWVNGTFHFTPHPDSTFTTLELWVKTAADAETRKVGAIEPGVPFSIESTKERNDPPHYVLSLWQFEVVAKNTAEEVVIRGDYRWEVDAIRGLPLDPYPPHPDRWNGATSLTLLEGQGSALFYQETANSRLCYFGVAGGCPGRHVPQDGAVVPYDASRVEVRLGGTAILGMGVRYHGADTWEYARATGTNAPPERIFTIPVEGNGDSPYAPQSLWEFIVDLDQPQGDPEVWTGSYTITVTAHK